MSNRDEAEARAELIAHQADRALGIIAGIARNHLYHFGAQKYSFQCQQHADEFAADFNLYAKSAGIPEGSYSNLIGSESVEIKLVKPEDISLEKVLQFAKQYPKVLTPSERVKLSIGNDWQAPKSRPLNERDGIRIIAEIARHAGAHTTEKGSQLTVMIRTTNDNVREDAVAKITANLAKIGLVVGEDLNFLRQGNSSTYSTEILNKDFASKINNAEYIRVIHSNALAA
jgi:hypothetical protein